MLSLNSGRFCSFSTPTSKSKAKETLKRTQLFWFLAEWLKRT